MTEIMEFYERRMAPRPAKARFVIDPVAFALVLVLAPLLVALLGFWIMGIPVIAVFFGGPCYLVAGTPVLLIYLHLRHGTAPQIAALALATVLIGGAIILVGDHLLSTRPSHYEILSFTGMGVIFGPLWGFAFGLIYNRLRNDLSRQPIPPLA